MKQKNITKEDLLKTFAELYWLKPYDIPWDAITAWNVQERINDEDRVLDLGCGDGILSALMFGGRLPIEYDRFINVKASHQKIGDQQSGDIYDNPIAAPDLIETPTRRIDVGLESKLYHMQIAESLGLYDKLVEGTFENTSFEDDPFDVIYSIFAFYWADDIESGTENVFKSLKDDGRFLVVLPSEHLYDMHLCKKIEETSTSEGVQKMFGTLDGGRRRLTTKYSRSVDDWKKYFDKYKMEVAEVVPVVNQVLFTFQDIGQRPFLPTWFNYANKGISGEQRNALKRELCEKVYPNFLTQFYEGLEGNPEVPHAYYLFEVRKS